MCATTGRHPATGETTTIAKQTLRAGVPNTSPVLCTSEAEDRMLYSSVEDAEGDMVVAEVDVVEDNEVLLTHSVHKETRKSRVPAPVDGRTASREAHGLECRI